MWQQTYSPIAKRFFPGSRSLRTIQSISTVPHVKHGTATFRSHQGPTHCKYFLKLTVIDFPNEFVHIYEMLTLFRLQYTLLNFSYWLKTFKRKKHFIKVKARLLACTCNLGTLFLKAKTNIICTEYVNVFPGKGSWHHQKIGKCPNWTFYAVIGRSKFL